MIGPGSDKKGNRTHFLLIQYFFLRFGVLDILCQFWKLFSRPIGCKMLFQTIFFKLLQWIIFTHYCSEQFFAKFCKYLFQTIFLGKLLSWIIFCKLSLWASDLQVLKIIFQVIVIASCSSGQFFAKGWLGIANLKKIYKDR